MLLVTFALASCSDRQQLERDLAKFQQRTAAVLESAPPQQAPLPLLSYPSAAQTRITVEQINLRLTDFYALQGCPVTTLIAQRNTALGKVQLPSQRYVYEVNLIAGLKDCISQQDEDAKKLPLNHWLAAKQRQLPKIWADMIQNSAEIKRTLSTNDGFIEGTAKDNFSAYYQALLFLSELKRAPSAEIGLIEQHLQALHRTPLLSRMAHTQNLLSARLTQTTDWLEAETTELSCDRPSKKQQITRLENVFNHYFVNQIQAVAAKLNEYHYKLAPLLNTLIASGELSPEFVKLLTNQQQSFKNYQQAMSEHIIIWQSIFKTCH